MKLSGSYFKEKWSETTRKQVFMLGIFPCGGPLGTPKWIQKGTQRPACGQDVWANVKNKPLTKLLGPFFKEKWSIKNRKQVFMLVFFSPFWGHFFTPKWIQKSTQRPVSKRDVWPIV
jgi:hypothetical protein